MFYSTNFNMYTFKSKIVLHEAARGNEIKSNIWQTPDFKVCKLDNTGLEEIPMFLILNNFLIIICYIYNFGDFCGSYEILVLP